MSHGTKRMQIIHQVRNRFHLSTRAARPYENRRRENHLNTTHHGKLGCPGHNSGWLDCECIDGGGDGDDGEDGAGNHG